MLDEALALQQRIEHALRAWRELSDSMPVGDSVCRLIETVTPPR